MGEIDELFNGRNASSATDDLGEVIGEPEKAAPRSSGIDEILRPQSNGFLVLGTDNPFIELTMMKQVCVAKLWYPLSATKLMSSKVKLSLLIPSISLTVFIETN